LRRRRYRFALRFGEAVYLFVYEVPKVLLLLTLVVFGMGVVRTFVSPERTRALLSGRRSDVGNVLAALLGIVTPFCSCSAVPLFIGFLTAGVARSDALVPDLGAGIHGYVPEDSWRRSWVCRPGGQCHLQWRSAYRCTRTRPASSL